MPLFVIFGLDPEIQKYSVVETGSPAFAEDDRKMGFDNSLNKPILSEVLKISCKVRLRKTFCQKDMTVRHIVKIASADFVYFKISWRYSKLYYGTD